MMVGLGGADLAYGLVALLATWAIESIVVRGVMGAKFGTRPFGDFLWINALTNPAANYAYSGLNWPWVVVEMIVVVVEIVPIGLSLRVPLRQAATLSLIANTASATVGLAIASWS